MPRKKKKKKKNMYKEEEEKSWKRVTFDGQVFFSSFLYIFKKLKNYKFFFFFFFTFPGKLEICLTDFGWEMFLRVDLMAGQWKVEFSFYY
jgi:hypothetical protein